MNKSVITEEHFAALLISDPSVCETYAKEIHAGLFTESPFIGVCELVLALYEQGRSVDMIAVITEAQMAIKWKGIITASFVTNLAMQAPAYHHAGQHLETLKRFYALRQIQSIAIALQQKSTNWEGDPLLLLDEAAKDLQAATDLTVTQKPQTLSDLLDDVLFEAEELGKGKGLQSIKAPIKALQRVTGGWRAGQVWILAARPGMGKTSFVVQCSIEAAKQQAKTLFVSLEMSEIDIVRRIMLSESNILESRHLFTTGINHINEANEAHKIADQLRDLPIRFLSEFSTLSRLVALIKTEVRTKGVKLVVIDYLQLVDGESKSNREQEVSKVSRELKKLALSLKIPIIVLSQLSRALETRPNKRPILSDLRDSGAIEQDADGVMFLYRDAIYSGDPNDLTAEVIVAKNRNGAVGLVDCTFDPPRMRYLDPEQIELQPQIPQENEPDF
jgi:replicative DNA helicase